MLTKNGSRLEIGPVQDDQQSGKDKCSLNELVVLDECPCLTIIRKDKWYFGEVLVHVSASCSTGQVEFSPIWSPTVKVRNCKGTLFIWVIFYCRISCLYNVMFFLYFTEEPSLGHVRTSGGYPLHTHPHSVEFICVIWIPMLWVYGNYKYFYYYSAGSTLDVRVKKFNLTVRGSTLDIRFWRLQTNYMLALMPTAVDILLF